MKKKHEWDETLLSAVLDAVTPTSTFVDVGAMVGYFSAVVAKEEPTATVIAIEPSIANLELAHFNLKAFQNARLLAGGISDDPSGSWLVVSDQTNRGNTRIELTSERRGSVPTCTLQSVVDYFGSDVVKIDVQGMEQAVLQSLKVSSSTTDLTIFCEVSPAAWGSQSDIVDMVMRFVSAGFDVYLLSESRAYSTFTAEKLNSRVLVGSVWADHFELVLTKGRYATELRERK